MLCLRSIFLPSFLPPSIRARVHPFAQLPACVRNAHVCMTASLGRARAVGRGRGKELKAVRIGSGPEGGGVDVVVVVVVVTGIIA